MVAPQCQDLIDRAQAAIGQNQQGNYRMGQLDAHIDALSQDGEQLRGILASKNVRTDFELYEHYDHLANRAQRQFKRCYRAVFFILLVTLAVSAAALAWPMSPHIEAWLQPLATMFVSLCLIVSLGAAWRLGRVGHYEQWQKHRANSEFLRRKHFENVLDERAAEQDGEIPLTLLKLEYFRRYQAELQYAYHMERGKQHERRATIARSFLSFCLLLAIAWAIVLFLSFLSALLEQGAFPDIVPNWIVNSLSSLQSIETWNLDALGLLIAVAVSIFYGLLMIATRLDDNIRNAARYTIVRENFEHLLGRPLNEARVAACPGNHQAHDAVRHYIAEVHSIMSNELADWVRLRDLELGRERLEQQTMR